MNSLIVLADLEDIIKGIGVAIFFLLWGLGPILKGIAERNAKKARGAQPGDNIAPQRGAAARGAANPEAEVERFLREVARDRGGQPSTVASEIVLGEDDLLQPSPQRTPASKKQPTRRRVSTSTEDIASRQLTSTLRDRPARHSLLEDADEKMADRVHDVFDHKLGQLGAMTGARAAAGAPADVHAATTPIISRTAIAISAAGMADLLRDPANVRQAILIHEILGPPRCESPDIGRSD